MELKPLGGNLPPAESQNAVPQDSPAQEPVLHNSPGAFVARAEAARMNEEGRKDRKTIIASMGIAAVAILLGIFVVATFAAQSRRKTQEFQLEARRAQAARIASAGRVEQEVQTTRLTPPTQEEHSIGARNMPLPPHAGFQRSNSPWRIVPNDRPANTPPRPYNGGAPGTTPETYNAHNDGSAH